MRTLRAIIIAIFLISAVSCGKYMLKSVVLENYISKAEVEENYTPKSKTQTCNYVTNAEYHTCRYLMPTGPAIAICMPVCPDPPDWEDMGIPCPK